MTQPAVTFGDPQAITRLRCVDLAGLDGVPDYIAALVADPDTTARSIVTKLPDTAPQSDLLVVRAEDWPEYTSPVSAANRLRFVAWSLDEDRAWDIAAWFHGKLLSLRGPDPIRGYFVDSPPRKGIDPTYNTPIVGFTVRLRLKPTVI